MKPPNKQAGACNPPAPPKLRNLQLTLPLKRLVAIAFFFSFPCFSTVSVYPGGVTENLPMVPGRDAGTDRVTACGKHIPKKNLNPQFDLADASFWKVRGLVCVLRFSTYQWELQSIARSSLE